MLLDCLDWKVQNDIENILAKPIKWIEVNNVAQEAQLIGMIGYSKRRLPIFAIGAGLSTFDKACEDKYVQFHIQTNEYWDCILLLEEKKKHGSYIGNFFFWDAFEMDVDKLN